MEGFSERVAVPPPLLVRFKDRHGENAAAELRSLFFLCGGLSVQFAASDRFPFCRITGVPFPWPQPLLRFVLDRAMLTYGFYEELGRGRSLDELVTAIDVPRFRALAEAPGAALRVSVETYGASLTQNEKRDRIFRVLAVLPERVRVDLKQPSLNLFLFEQMAELTGRGPDNPLVGMYFAREVASNVNGLEAAFSLKSRAYLNTTSMDPCLAFVMANLALCRPGTLAFDPFVGSGSVLVACAALGSHCWGSDLDPRVFRDATTGASVADNFRQYGFSERFLGVVRADFSQSWLRRSAPLFDAIVTDPPYGVREGIRKVGRKQGRPRKELPEALDPGFVHVPQRVPYPVDELLRDLVDLAADTLVPGGRLVFWHATSKEEPIEAWSDERLPVHPDMELLNVGLQICGTLNRRLVLYGKRA